MVVYLDGELVEEEGAFRGDKWVVKALLEFLRPFLEVTAQIDSTATASSEL